MRSEGLELGTLIQGLLEYRMFATKSPQRNQGMWFRPGAFGWRSSYAIRKVLTRDGSCRAKEAVAAMIKRLAHRNANVQLYTLEVRTLPSTA